VNLGKNKLSENSVQDYCDGLKIFAQVSDYIVINVSSPNTPGLRKLQEKNSLKVLLTEVLKTNQSLDQPKPIFLKLSPDLLDAELKDICKLIKTKECKVAGLIISNTTIERPQQLISKNQSEAGGLSGKPLKDKSTRMIEEVYKLTNGNFTIIGVGGISTGDDAYEKILAGASAVQIYSSFVFHGIPLVTKIKKELDEKLKQNGFASVKDAVGKKHKKNSWFSIF
jgi:dihydroorotate dehydrogenase